MLYPNSMKVSFTSSRIQQMTKSTLGKNSQNSKQQSRHSKEEKTKDVPAATVVAEEGTKATEPNAEDVDEIKEENNAEDNETKSE